MERLILTVLLLAFGAAAAQAVSQAKPLILENRHLSLRFDPQSGAWIGLTDRKDGTELVVGTPVRALATPPGVPKLDTGAIQHALERGKALSLAGDWLYTPVPPPPDLSAAFLQERFDGAQWETTGVPSRRGSGDDRLHNRTGDFWYRREFSLPSGWSAGEMALVIGAVDDFDVTYLNGQRIGGTGQETPHFWETPRFYRIPGRLLRRDRPNILLLKVTNGAYDGGIAGPVVIGQISALKPPALDAPPLSAHSRMRRGKTVVLRMTARSSEFEYTMEYLLPDDGTLFSRQLTIRSLSASEKLIQTVTYPSPAFSTGARQSVIFPGSLPVGDAPMRSLADGEMLGSRGQDPLAILWDAGKRRGLGAWYHCEEEFAPVAVRRAGAGAEIRHAQSVIIRLAPGQSVTLGRQYFWLTRGTRDEALRGVQAVYRQIGLRAPSGGLSRLREKTLYCGHPGGPPELNYRTYGGFQAIRAYLPTLQRMGIDLLWFLPIWEHGDGTVWNLYSPFDHFQVSPLYGSPEELKRLSEECGRRGIRLMFDLVPHGPPDFTPLAKENPDWICRDPDGRFIYVWNQYAFDNAHPGWQDYMRRAAAWGGREFGAVGARVDCGAGSPPNWNPQRGNRPSLSTLAGALGMNRAIREGYLQAQREVVLLPEEYTGANIFYRVADLTYDAQLYFLMADLQEGQASPAEWARALQRFLHDQQQTLPPGALKMRWISNHDTVSWTFQKQRPARLYGSGRMRALLALCAFVEGVPMLYQGDEDPAVYGGTGESHVEYLSAIYGLRKKLSALRTGSADYQSAQATGGVFACLREAKEQRALVLISFHPETIESAVTLPAGVSGTWQDALTGETFTASGKLRLPMSGHQARVLIQSR